MSKLARIAFVLPVLLSSCAWWSKEGPVAKTTATTCLESDVDGVMQQVLSALHGSDYASALGTLGKSVGVDLVDCALKTVVAVLAPPAGSAPTVEYLHATAYLRSEAAK